MRRRSFRPARYAPRWTALVVATVAAALLAAIAISPAPAGSLSPMPAVISTLRPGEGTAATPTPAPTEREPAPEAVIRDDAQCVTPDGTDSGESDGCSVIPDAADHHAVPIAVPPWEDPAVPAADTFPGDAPPTNAGPTPAESPVQPPADTAAAAFVWPLAGAITSLFGPAHPLGIDIATESGRGIGAVAGGRVAVSAYDEGYGYYVLINHSDGYSTLYSHFMTPPEGGAGDTVSPGQIIGYVGTTGRSTGPHLHFEVRLFDRVVDPLTVLPEIQLVIDPVAYRAPPVAPVTCPDSGAIPVNVPAGMEATCPVPNPSPMPEPTPSPEPSPTPSPSPSPQPEETPVPDPSETPSTAEHDAEAGDPSPSPSPLASAPAALPLATPVPAPATPMPLASLTPTPSPSPLPIPTPSPSPTPSPTPASTPLPSPSPAPSAWPLPSNGALDAVSVEQGLVAPRADAAPASISPASVVTPAEAVGHSDAGVNPATDRFPDP